LEGRGGKRPVQSAFLEVVVGILPTEEGSDGPGEVGESEEVQNTAFF